MTLQEQLLVLPRQLERALRDQRFELLGVLLDDAPVTGPMTMMIATTTPPITMPAKSPGERASTIPRIASISTHVKTG